MALQDKGQDTGQAAAAVRRVRLAAFSLLVAALALVLLVAWGAGDAGAQSVRPPDDALNTGTGPEPGPAPPRGTASVSEYWRALKAGDRGVASSATADGQAMTTTGQQWRLLREQYIRKYAGWIPAGVIAILLLFHLIKGKMRLKDGFAGRTVPRFSSTQRVAHWFMASIFILLGISGILILLGRPVLLPLLGPKAHSVILSAAMQGHNLFGPLFIVALVWMFLLFLRGNFFQLVDFQWMLKLGGLLGGHVSSRRYNFGEKSWFWMVVLVGIVMSATGLALEFPWLFEDLRVLQLSTILHVAGGILLISVAIGHIYVGTIGMEGSIDSMLTGEADENWAKEHHDLWYEEVTGKPANPPASETAQEGGKAAAAREGSA